MKRRVWQRHTQLKWMEMNLLVQSGFQMSANKTDLSWIGSGCNDVALLTELDTLKPHQNVLVITTSNPPGGVGEQNPTIHNHWEKITWTSKFFRHDICRLGRFQTKSWKPWSESALWDSSILCLRTNPHKHLSQILWVLFEQVFNLTTLFSHLLKFIFPKQIFKGWRRSSWPYKCCWSAFSGVCRFEKATRSVGEAQASVLLLSICRASKKLYWMTDRQLCCSQFLFTQLRTKTVFQSKDLGNNWRVSQVCSSHSEKKHSFDILHSFSIKIQIKIQWNWTNIAQKKHNHEKQWLCSSLFSPTECRLEQFWLDLVLGWSCFGLAESSMILVLKYLSYSCFPWSDIFRCWGNGTLFFLKLLFVVHKTNTSMRVWTSTLRYLNQTPSHIQKKQKQKKESKNKTTESTIQHFFWWTGESIWCDCNLLYLDFM